MILPGMIRACQLILRTLLLQALRTSLRLHSPYTTRLAGCSTFYALLIKMAGSITTKENNHVENLHKNFFDAACGSCRPAGAVCLRGTAGDEYGAGHL